MICILVTCCHQIRYCIKNVDWELRTGQALESFSGLTELALGERYGRKHRR